jgi:glycosyltransferase involved in cell wall biosynthesis
VTTLHDVLPLEIPGYFKNAEAEARYRRSRQRDLLRTNLLLTVSEYAKAGILREFEVPVEPQVIRWGPTLEIEARSHDFPFAPDSYFLYVGGYDRRKDLDTLVKVYNELFRQGRLTQRLLLVGMAHYYSEGIKQLIEEGRGLGSIQELGYVSDSELGRLYANATGLIYPSRYEGYGLPPLEAMAHGCPVMTTPFSSIPEICGDAVCYVDPQESSAFAEMIVAFAERSELRSAGREKGLAQAAKFTWSRAATTYLTALDRAVQGKRRKG